MAALIGAAISSIAIAPLRMIERPAEQWGSSLFLAFVGLLALTAAVDGARAVNHRRTPGRLDGLLPGVLLLASIALGLWSASSGFRLGLVFAPLGVLVALPPLRAIRHPTDGAVERARSHRRSMIIACISTITAFLVVNAKHFLPPEYAWIAWVAPTAAALPFFRPRRRAVRADLSAG